MNQSITLYLVEDHLMLRQGLRKTLAPMESVRVVGETGLGEVALAELEELRPDVLVVDLGLPDINGFEVIERARAMLPEMKVILITQYDSRDYVQKALGLGVRGYILKGDAIEHFIAAIPKVLDGELCLSPSLASMVLEPDEDVPDLTSRELEVLRYLANGHDAASIAGKMDISPTTVKTHKANIMKKLGMHRTVDLVQYAMRMGMA